MRTELEQQRTAYASIKAGSEGEAAQLRSQIEKLQAELADAQTRLTVTTTGMTSEVARCEGTVEVKRSVVVEFSDVQGSGHSESEAYRSPEKRTIGLLKEELRQSREECDVLRVALDASSNRSQGNSLKGSPREVSESQGRLMSDKNLTDPLLPGKQESPDCSSDAFCEESPGIAVLLYLITLCVSFFQIAAVPASSGVSSTAGVASDFGRSGTTYSDGMKTLLPLCVAVSSTALFLLIGLRPLTLQNRVTLVVSTAGSTAGSLLLAIGANNSVYPLILLGSAVVGACGTASVLSAAARIFGNTKRQPQWTLVAVVETCAFSSCAAFAAIPTLSAIHQSAVQAFWVSATLGIAGICAGFALLFVGPSPLPCPGLSSWTDLFRELSAAQRRTSIANGLCAALTILATSNSPFFDVSSDVGVLSLSIAGALAGFALLFPIFAFVFSRMQVGRSAWLLLAVSLIVCAFVAAGSSHAFGSGFLWIPLLSIGAFAAAGMASLHFLISSSGTDFHGKATLSCLTLLVSLPLLLGSVTISAFATNRLSSTGSWVSCVVPAVISTALFMLYALSVNRGEEVREANEDESRPFRSATGIQ